MKFLVVAALCLASVNAFQLRPAARVQLAQQTQSRLVMLQKPVGLQVAKASMTALKQTETDTTIVASDNNSFISKIWNEKTKLVIYLGIWYLGNIYCTCLKTPPFLVLFRVTFSFIWFWLLPNSLTPSHIHLSPQTTFTTRRLAMPSARTLWARPMRTGPCLRCSLPLASSLWCPCG